MKLVLILVISIFICSCSMNTKTDSYHVTIFSYDRDKLILSKPAPCLEKEDYLEIYNNFINNLHAQKVLLIENNMRINAIVHCNGSYELKLVRMSRLNDDTGLFEFIEP